MSDTLIAPVRVLRRALANVVLDEHGHLLSQYSLGSHGYPQIGWTEDGKDRMILCHRLVWAAARGPIPIGMTIDHLCRVRRCINVEHLRLLTNLENARRTSGRDWPLGTCLHGHDDAKHWHQPTGGGKGYCRECRRLTRLRTPRAERALLVGRAGDERAWVAA